MRSVRLALPVIALAAGALVSPARASWSCTYYKWDAYHQRWVRVELLIEESLYESQPGHQRGQSWDCKYCYVPAVPPPPAGQGGVDVAQSVDDAVALLPAPVRDLAAQARDQVAAAEELAPQPEVHVGPPPPECPLVPPEDPLAVVSESAGR